MLGENMKRRRISTEKLEQTIRNLLPFYKLASAYRPDGEYINGSRFEFKLVEDRPGYPKRFTFADYTEEDERMNFAIEYPEGESEKVHGAEHYHMICDVKSAIGVYSGFLDLNQVEEVVARALREVFTERYIQENKEFFDQQVNQMTHFYFDAIDREGDKMKAGVLYAKLKKETIYMPLRNADNHFIFTFAGQNEFDKPDRLIVPGEIYQVYLPIGDDQDLGGGNKRPCLILGQSSTDRYFVSPIYHSENPKTIDEEYFLNYGSDGRARYVTRGLIYSVPKKDIYNEQARCDMKDYERIMNLIGRDNKITTGIHDFSVGIGAMTAGEIYKAQINFFDRTFELPKPEELLEMITHPLKKFEKRAGREIFKRDEKGFVYESMQTEDGFLLKIPRVGETIPLVVQMDKNLPLDIFSNRKELDYGVVGKHDYTPDITLMGSYRYCMSKKYPLFKFMMLKRLVKLFNSHYHSDRFAGVDDVEKYASRLKSTLNACRLEYDGDYEELIRDGIEKIVFKKLRFILTDKKQTNDDNADEAESDK